jgi:cytochrome c-type biogenesis protein CcmH/NrfG
MGDLDSAVATYGKLVESGEDLNLLISDLEGAVGTQGENARLRTVLGDAYMRNGQLQKALDAYRQALDSL